MRFPSLSLDIGEERGRSSYQQFGHLNSELYCSEFGRLQKYMAEGGECGTGLNLKFRCDAIVEPSQLVAFFIAKFGSVSLYPNADSTLIPWRLDAASYTSHCDNSTGSLTAIEENSEGFILNEILGRCVNRDVSEEIRNEIL
jgi:hypothetical protein